MARLNRKIKAVKPSATLVINELSAKLEAEGKEVFKLGFGQSPFPVPEILVNALKENAHQKAYLPVLGLEPLRESVAGFYRREYALETNPDLVSIGPGSKELIYDYLLVSELDELLLPQPSWVSYEPQGLLTNHKVVWLQTKAADHWKLTTEVIDDHCKNNPGLTRTIILNYPSNPIGNTYDSKELKALAHSFRKYNITVIADEIYGELHHEGNHDTIAKYYPEGTIISTGLSKWAGAGGWRLGVFAFPKELHYVQDAMAVAASETYTTASAPIQYAAVKAYEDVEELKEYRDTARKILKGVGQYCFKALQEMNIQLPEPQGGFYLYPDFSNHSALLSAKGFHSSLDFCKQLLKDTGVALLAGSNFGHPDSIVSARLSYVDFDGSVAMHAAKTIYNDKTVDREFVVQYCPKLIKALERLEFWTRKQNEPIKSSA